MKKFLCSFLVAACVFFASAPIAFADPSSWYSVPFAGTVWHASGEGSIHNMEVKDFGHGPVYRFQGQKFNAMPFTGPVTFYSGNYYSVYIAFEASKMEDPPTTEDITFSVSMDASGSYKRTFTLNDTRGTYSYYGWYTFYCDHTFESEFMSIEFDNISSAVIIWSLREFRYAVQSPSDYEAEQNKDFQDALINGSGMTPAPGIDTDDFTDAVGGMAGAEDAIGDAIGGFENVQGELDSIMHPELDSDITDAFSGIRNVFTRVVSVMDLSSPMIFMLVFGLALFVIGRRVR